MPGDGTGDELGGTRRGSADFPFDSGEGRGAAVVRDPHLALRLRHRDVLPLHLLLMYHKASKFLRVEKVANRISSKFSYN